MEYKEIIDSNKEDFEKAVSYFKEQLLQIRHGNFSPSLIENIKVDCFGSSLPIKQLGAVGLNSPKEISIQLWDKSYVDSVVKEIQKRNFGLGIKIEGNIIYLSVPPLTEESKKSLIKIINEKKEESLQAIRHIRDKAWKKIQDSFQKGEIREDDKYKGKEELDKVLRKAKEEIESLAEEKEKEIL